MLDKVLKYDVKAIAKMVLPMYIVAIILSCISRLFSALSKNSNVLLVFSSLITGVTALVLCAMFVVTIVALLYRFTNNMFKAESYLTHTLPVKTSYHLLSKYLTAIIYTLATVGICIACIFIGFPTGNININIDGNKIFSSAVIVALVVLLTMALIYYVFLFSSAIAFGQKGNSRIKRTILALIVMHIIEQTIVVIFLLIGVFIVDKNAFTEKTVTLMFYMFSVIYAILIVAHGFFANNILKKLEIQ